MTDQGVLFAATFFDSPGLLAVRFARQGGNRLAADRIATFASERRPDVAPPGWFGGFGGIIGVGLAVMVVGGIAVNSCSQTTSHPQVASPASPRRAMPVISDALDIDASESRAWTGLLTGLAYDYSPTREDLRPWAVRTLLEVPRELGLRGDASGGWLRPRCAAADRSAFQSGKELAELLRATGSGPEVAVILDLPGPTAIAAAAGMARHFEPVITIDNLPHPAGVVPAAQALGALVYWRPTFVAARADRAPTAAPVFVLEGARLAPYRNEPDRFDNRSRARLPDAAGLRTLGITRVLYVRERAGEVAERDDLNAGFIELAKAGIEVRHLALASLAGLPSAPIARNDWFWASYGWHRPPTVTLAAVDHADARYRSTPRETAFSARTQVPYDGGEREHAAIVSNLAKQEEPPPAATSSSSSSHSGRHFGGGSWSRSSGSHHYG